MLEVQRIVEELISTKGKNAKMETLASYGDNDLFLEVLTRTYDPKVTYGVGSKTILEIERKNNSGDQIIGDVQFQTLNDLRDRKLTGNAAKDALLKTRTSLTSGQWTIFKNIILKNLKTNFSDETVHKIYPDLFEIFRVALAEKYNVKKVKKWPVAVDIKHDGVRVTTVVRVKEGTAKTLSREGNEFYSFKKVASELLTACRAIFKNYENEPERVFIFDGEIDSGKFNKTVGDIHKKEYQADDAIYRMFDMLSENEFFGDNETSQQDRRARLEKFVKITKHLKLNSLDMVHSELAYNDAEVQALFDKYFKGGHEGAIVKLREAPYENRRCYNLMKLKNESSEDLTIVGFESGEAGKKYENVLGAVIVDYNGVMVNVSSGFSDEQRTSLWQNRDELIGHIIEVLYHEETPDKSLRHPRFKKFRDTLKKGHKE